MKTYIKTVLLLFILTSVSCSFSLSETGKPRYNSRTFTVATWNVQNIFNAIDDGNEYEEYLQSSGWNQECYKSRLNNLAMVFSYFNADAVVLNEVENATVVEDIIAKLNDYPYYSIANEDSGAISIAVISKYPIGHSCVHAVPGTRPILQTDIDTPNGTVRVFAVHGKSKRDSEIISKNTRLLMGQTLELVSRHEDENLTILAGDFNEDISENNIFCDIRYGISDAPIKVCPTYGSNYWYNPFSDPEMNFSSDGSYYYNSTWMHYDNILCSYSPNWSVSDADIINRGILLTADGKPNSYNRALLKGVSDHLPVTLTFEY